MVMFAGVDGAGNIFLVSPAEMGGSGFYLFIYFR